jgi:hypothetical protein
MRMSTNLSREKRLKLVIGIQKHNHRNICMLLGKLCDKSKSMRDLVVNVMYRPLARWNGYNYHHLSITFPGHNHDYSYDFEMLYRRIRHLALKYFPVSRLCQTHYYYC